MSLKSTPLVVSKETPPISTPPLLDVTSNNEGKLKCWCAGRHHKEHHVGDPFCNLPSTYKDPAIDHGKTGTISASNLVIMPQNIALSGPTTFDEDLLHSCINRAIAKTPPDFVTMLEEGRVNLIQARHINNELRLMGYCLSQEPF